MLYGLANLQYVRILADEGYFQDAARQIEVEPNTLMAQEYYNFLLNNYNVLLWDAFLKNDNFKTFLSAQRLINLFRYLGFCLMDDFVSVEKKQKIQEIIGFLTQNEDVIAVVKTAFPLEIKRECIEYFVKLNMSEIATTWIILDDNLQTEFKPFLYVQLCQRFDPLVVCACLKNKQFEMHITFNDLHWMIRKSLEALEKKYKGAEHYEAILVLIAQNENWCRMICYANFLSYATSSPTLAHYITSTASFLIHLEPYHIGVLSQTFPKLQAQLLKLLQAISIENNQKLPWAIRGIKIICSQMLTVKPEVQEDDLLKEFNRLIIRKPQTFQVKDNRVVVGKDEMKQRSQANSLS